MRLGEAYQITYEDKAHDRAVVVLPKKMPPTDALERRMLLCIKENGTPILSASFKAMLQKHNLNAHSFRHTHATQLIEAGAKPVDVAARLGHKDATITQNLYAHDTEEMQKETVAIFSRIVSARLARGEADSLSTAPLYLRRPEIHGQPMERL